MRCETIKAIYKLAPGDVELIVKDIIASLPSFKPPSSRGKELLDILLAHVRAAFASDIHSDAKGGSSSHWRYYLDLASFVTLEKRLVHPSHLLEFYHATFVQKRTVERLPEQHQAYVMSEVAHILSACGEANGRAPPTTPIVKPELSDSADDSDFHSQLSDICAALLQVSRFRSDILANGRDSYMNRYSLKWNPKGKNLGLLA